MKKKETEGKYLTRGDFGIYTIVMLTYMPKAYGIVIDPETYLRWLMCENRDMAEDFKESTRERGDDHMIPIVLLGEAMGNRNVYVGGAKESEKYFMQFQHINVCGEIKPVPSLEVIKTVLWHLKALGKLGGYLRSVGTDIMALEIYFSGDYDLDGYSINHVVKKRIQFFEDVLWGARLTSTGKIIQSRKTRKK